MTLSVVTFALVQSECLLSSIPKYRDDNRITPITGITLPLMSYGGSSLLTYMIAIGFILNVRSRTKIFMFK